LRRPRQGLGKCHYQYLQKRWESSGSTPEWNLIVNSSRLGTTSNRRLREDCLRFLDLLRIQQTGNLNLVNLSPSTNPSFKPVLDGNSSSSEGVVSPSASSRLPLPRPSAPYSSTPPSRQSRSLFPSRAPSSSPSAH